jgi:hypothetical protein
MSTALHALIKEFSKEDQKFIQRKASASPRR